MRVRVKKSFLWRPHFIITFPLYFVIFLIMVLCSCLTGCLRANQTPCASLSIGGVPDNRRLHQRWALHLHCHLPRPPQTQPAGGCQATNHRDGGWVSKQKMGGICLHHLPQWSVHLWWEKSRIQVVKVILFTVYWLFICQVMVLLSSVHLFCKCLRASIISVF